MKKSLLLTLACALFTVGAFAQSLSLSWTGGSLSNGDTVTYYGDTATTLAAEDIDCTNNGATALAVKVRKYPISIVSGSENSFCWGTCYLPNTLVSSMSVNINPSETSIEFIGDYKAKGNIGTSIVMYTFFDMNNPDDSVCLFVKYDCNMGSGVENNDPVTVEFSNAYPNPARDFTTFNYSLPASGQQARLILRDILGNVVSNTEINDHTGSLRLETGSLTDGVYFYSLLLNEQPFLTRKLIIKH